MLFERVLYFGADFRFHTGDVEVDAGRIAAVRPRGCIPRAMLLPGLVDIHLHLSLIHISEPTRPY